MVSGYETNCIQKTINLLNNMPLISHSAKIRADQKQKLKDLAKHYGISVNAVIIKLIDRARIK